MSMGQNHETFCGHLQYLYEAGTFHASSEKDMDQTRIMRFF